LLLVHDGYQHLDQAIDDLRRRGFPTDSEVLLLSVSDLFRTPLHSVGTEFFRSAPNRASLTPNLPKYKKTRAFFEKLESVKRQAHARLQAAFPNWHIRFERPLAWQPELIFFCACGQSVTSNPGLSEIIRKLLTESNIPLTVARRQSQRQTTRRFSVVVFDGPASAAAVLKELQRRPADRGSEIYLIFYTDRLMSHAERWSVGYEECGGEWVESQLVKTRNAIEVLGHKVTCVNVVGNTAQAIVQEAKRVDAESILLGIGPFAGVGSASMQNIAARVAAQANCSVEIVFPGQPPRPTATVRAIAAPQNIAAWKGRDDSRVGSASSM
jgi:nucleotide-binding universal stress UspA family protein